MGKIQIRYYSYLCVFYFLGFSAESSWALENNSRSLAVLPKKIYSPDHPLFGISDQIESLEAAIKSACTSERPGDARGAVADFIVNSATRVQESLSKRVQDLKAQFQSADETAHARARNALKELGWEDQLQKKYSGLRELGLELDHARFTSGVDSEQFKGLQEKMRNLKKAYDSHSQAAPPQPEKALYGQLAHQIRQDAVRQLSEVGLLANRADLVSQHATHCFATAQHASPPPESESKIAATVNPTVGPSFK